MPSIGRSISLRYIHDRANPAYIVLGDTIEPSKQTTAAEVQATFDLDSVTEASNFYDNAAVTYRFFATIETSIANPTYCALVVYDEGKIIELIAIEPTTEAAPNRYTFKFKGLTI